MKSAGRLIIFEYFLNRILKHKNTPTFLKVLGKVFLYIIIFLKIISYNVFQILCWRCWDHLFTLKNWQCTVKQSFIHLCLNCKPINKIGCTNKWTILNCFETKHTSMENGFQQRMEKLSKVCSACQTLSGRNFLIFWKVIILIICLFYIFLYYRRVSWAISIIKWVKMKKNWLRFNY